jgi:outer membrane immunogenic protein
VGLEADIQGALEKDTNNLSPVSVDFISSLFEGCGPPAVTEPCTATASYTTQIEWFGTVRARIGYVWGNGEVLSYLTGGLAYGEVKINGTNTVSGHETTGACDCDFLFSQTQTFGHSQINTGWVVGFGTERKLLIPGWTLKAEYLYMDLGTLDATSGTPGSSCVFLAGPINPCVTPGFPSGGQITTHTHFTDNIFRVGLNYQFH